jgi:regulator of protease activity HflC (stomatin/prohibitin superfamily)
MLATLIILGVVAVIVLFLVFSAVFTVEQQTAAIIERFGKFQRVARAGLNFKIPIVESIAGRINLRVQQLDVTVETKTFDNVFVVMVVAVQYVVIPTKVFDAFYRLDRPTVQITAYVFDNVRARVPKMPLDDVFERKDEVALAVKQELANEMDEFGYMIVQALVTDIDPDRKVKDSMNEINAARRLREAAQERGEAEKILLVKQAEAEAESKALQGKGITAQGDHRRAPRLGGPVPAVDRWHEPGVDHATRAHDPALRHDEGDRCLVAEQHDLCDLHPRGHVRPGRADAQRAHLGQRGSGQHATGAAAAPPAVGGTRTAASFLRPRAGQWWPCASGAASPKSPSWGSSLLGMMVMGATQSGFWGKPPTRRFSR